MSKRTANLVQPRKVMAALIGCCIATQASCDNWAYIAALPTNLDGRWILLEPGSLYTDAWLTISDGRVTHLGFNDDEGLGGRELEASAGIDIDENVLSFEANATQAFGGVPEIEERVNVVVSFNGIRVQNGDASVPTGSFLGGGNLDYTDLRDEDFPAWLMRRAETMRCCLNGGCMGLTERECWAAGGSWREGDCIYDPCAPADDAEAE